MTKIELETVIFKIAIAIGIGNTLGEKIPKDRTIIEYAEIGGCTKEEIAGIEDVLVRIIEDSEI